MQRFLNEESVGESCLSGFPLSDGARPVHPGVRTGFQIQGIKGKFKMNWA